MLPNKSLFVPGVMHCKVQIGKVCSAKNRPAVANIVPHKACSTHAGANSSVIAAKSVYIFHTSLPDKNLRDQGGYDVTDKRIDKRHSRLSNHKGDSQLDLQRDKLSVLCMSNVACPSAAALEACRCLLLTTLPLKRKSQKPLQQPLLALKPVVPSLLPR